MEKPALAERLQQYNQWRRGAEMEQPDPRQLGKDLDCAVEIICAAAKTLHDNLHLCDGEQCTLRELRDAFGANKN